MKLFELDWLDLNQENGLMSPDNVCAIRASLAGDETTSQGSHSSFTEVLTHYTKIFYNKFTCAPVVVAPVDYFNSSTLTTNVWLRLYISTCSNVEEWFFPCTGVEIIDHSINYKLHGTPLHLLLPCIKRCRNFNNFL